MPKRANRLHFVWGLYFCLGLKTPSPTPMPGYVPAFRRLCEIFRRLCQTFRRLCQTFGRLCQTFKRLTIECRYWSSREVPDNTKGGGVTNCGHMAPPDPSNLIGWLSVILIWFVLLNTQIVIKNGNNRRYVVTIIFIKLFWRVLKHFLLLVINNY